MSERKTAHGMTHESECPCGHKWPIHLFTVNKDCSKCGKPPGEQTYRTFHKYGTLYEEYAPVKATG